MDNRRLSKDKTHFFVQGKRVPFVRRSSSNKISPAHLQQRVKHHLYQSLGWWTQINILTFCQLIHGMITELKNLCSSGERTFQQDLAPCYNSKKVKTFFEQNEFRLLEWPGNSPGINPIENLWAICKKKYLRWISLRKAILLLR